MSHHLAVRDGIFAGLGVTAVERPALRLGLRAGGVFSPKASAAEYKPRFLGEVTESAILVERQQAIRTASIVAGIAGLAVGLVLGRYTKK